jgi:gamma-glutamyltranspeptidase
MAPSIALDRDDRPRLVVGSAGSARLRGAIMQIVVNVLEHGLGVDEAIDRVRSARPNAAPTPEQVASLQEWLRRRGADPM